MAKRAATSAPGSISPRSPRATIGWTGPSDAGWPGRRAATPAFATLHASAARLFNCRPEEIAVGSSATELLSSLAWAVAPAAGSNIVSTDLEFPSTVYPWARVARHTGAEVRLGDMKGDHPLAGDLIAFSA